MGMDARKRVHLVVQRTILTVLLIGGCVKCLLWILPASRL